MSEEKKSEERKSWIRREKDKGRGDYAGAVVGNLIALVLINLYPVWRPWTAGVVTGAWVRTLWAADLSLLAQICGSLILVFFSPRWLRRFLELIFSATGLLSLAVFWTVFPLDFSHVVGEWLNLLVRIILVVGIAATAIGVVVNLIRLIFFWWRPED